MKLRLLLAALVLPLLPVALAAPSQADGGDAVVTFPEVTRFNPDLTDYVLEMHDPAPGLGALRLLGNDVVLRSLPSTGSVQVDFGNHQGAGLVLRVERCSTACVETARSEPLAIFRNPLLVPFGADPRRLAHAGEVGFNISDVYFPAGEQIDFTWQISEEPGGAVMASGTQTRGREESGPIALKVTVPEDLRQNGTYRLDVTASVDTDDFGPLSGANGVSFVFDEDADSDVVPVTLRTFYPVVDGYRDQLSQTFRFRNPLRSVALDLLDGRGRVLTTFRRSEGFTTATTVSRWDGRIGKKLVPAGRYSLRVKGIDVNGNRADVRTPLQISHQELTWKTWSKQVAPRTSLIDSAVGRCSTLKDLPSGGLGLYSQTSCTRAAQSVVVTVHGLYIPQAFRDRYSNFQVTVTGGRAQGADDAYLVLGYLDEDGDFTARAELDGSRGKHAGDPRKATGLIHDRRTAAPYVVWQTGLTAGSRYDVKKFRVKVRYQTLS